MRLPFENISMTLTFMGCENDRSKEDNLWFDWSFILFVCLITEKLANLTGLKDLKLRDLGLHYFISSISRIRYSNVLDWGYVNLMIGILDLKAFFKVKLLMNLESLRANFIGSSRPYPRCFHQLHHWIYFQRDLHRNSTCLFCLLPISTDLSSLCSTYAWKSQEVVILLPRNECSAL